MLWRVSDIHQLLFLCDILVEIYSGYIRSYCAQFSFRIVKSKGRVYENRMYKVSTSS